MILQNVRKNTRFSFKIGIWIGTVISLLLFYVEFFFCYSETGFRFQFSERLTRSFLCLVRLKYTWFSLAVEDRRPVLCPIPCFITDEGFFLLFQDYILSLIFQGIFCCSSSRLIGILTTLHFPNVVCHIYIYLTNSDVQQFKKFMNMVKYWQPERGATSQFPDHMKQLKVITNYPSFCLVSLSPIRLMNWNNLIYIKILRENFFKKT